MNRRTGNLFKIMTHGLTNVQLRNDAAPEVASSLQFPRPSGSARPNWPVSDSDSSLSTENWFVLSSRHSRPDRAEGKALSSFCKSIQPAAPDPNQTVHRFVLQNRQSLSVTRSSPEFRFAKSAQPPPQFILQKHYPPRHSNPKTSRNPRHHKHLTKKLASLVRFIKTCQL